MTDDHNNTADQIAQNEVETPSCGLYIILPDTDDHEKQCFKLGQALHAANRFSNYSQNRHIVEFRANQNQQISEAFVKAYQETCARNGFIFLVYDDAKLARAVGADGVVCSSLQKATESRKLIDESSIIGLRCSTKSAAQSAIDHALDFITIASDKHGDPLLDILNWWTTTSENPIAVEGPFNQENCEKFVKAEATFIDSSHHIWTHPSGNVMQGVVNMMDAFERFKPIITKLH